jgi:SNF2 family DNA or RNA helicase
MLINYDLPWNAGTAVQRNWRITRVSSEWDSVVVQDLMVRGSIDERLYAMREQKSAVADAVIDGHGINDEGGLSLTLGSLGEFLQTALDD